MEPNWQQMVDPDDDPEPSDDSVLHVPVQAEHREFVLHAANALLAAGAGKPYADPIESLAVAQELASSATRRPIRHSLRRPFTGMGSSARRSTLGSRRA